jgi:proteasome accessory factor A
MSISKFGGRDCELSTCGEENGRSIDNFDVTRDILRQIGPALESLGASDWTSLSGRGSPYSMDCLRHWGGGGQSWYADMSHVECCTASCLDPQSFAAQCLSIVLAAEKARQLAQAKEAIDGGVVKYSLSTSNADVLDPSISFGTHISFCIDTPLWEDLVDEHRRPAVLGFVASALAAATVFFGNGYILPLKDGSTIYSPSARAHHLTKMVSLSTTQAYGRGLLNSRRESHGKGFERLHLINFDFCLLSAAPMFSLMQNVLAAAEEGYCGLNLCEPLKALRLWSWSLDPATGKLPAVCTLVDGRNLTVAQYIAELTRTLLEMHEGGLIKESIAPHARLWLPKILELAHYVEEGSLEQSSRHLTWAAKLLWLMQLGNQEGLSLGDPAMRLADHDFTNTNPEQGAIWQLWEAGLVDPFVTLDDAKAALVEGPVESRDWGRGQLIRRWGESIADIDWGYVEVRRGGGAWGPRLRIDLPQLDSLNAENRPLLDRATDLTHLCELMSPETSTRVDPIDNITRQLPMYYPQPGNGRRRYED